ncbi:CHAP domain-containing protein [Spongisporangium articulatum]|uniref:CHAP domain-containing protein n=1 Tax=Spongisporangium articulatum TaxID=3362603 RepID=A0ABW8AVP5_9ACTN
MGSVSGLEGSQRRRARDRAVQAAELAWNNADDIRYTQDPRRWNGIRNNRDARLGKYPKWADCSSFVTWCLWNGLFLKYGLPDTVNGADWTGGYTGTLLDNGRKVADADKALPGDLVHYPPTGNWPRHVGIVVGRNSSDHLMVIEHGSDASPLHLKYDYRRVGQIRRYI